MHLILFWGPWAYPGGSEPTPKNFEPCSRCGSNFFGGGPDPPGYAPVGVVSKLCHVKTTFSTPPLVTNFFLLILSQIQPSHPSLQNWDAI